MRPTRLRSGSSITALLVLLTGSVVSLPASIRLDARDTNGDGRPDVWQYLDSRGALVRVNRDTNFDGRPDVQEWYEHGRLVRRGSDRNFDDRVDLIDEFDAVSGAHTRAVVDADFDGRADLLVVFADGEPVFSKWAAADGSARVAGSVETLSERDSDDSPLPLSDPFSTVATLRHAASRIPASAACVTVRWIAPPVCVFPALLGDTDPAAPTSVDPASVALQPSRPRGPPAPGTSV